MAPRCDAGGQILTNPDFEGEDTGWSASGNVIVNYTTEAAHSGSWCAWMGGYGAVHTDVLGQVVELPADCRTYTLTFWLHIDTRETTLEAIGPGCVEIHAPIRPEIMTSYAPVVHGGIVGLLADCALAHAALSLAAPGAMGVTVEYKLNLMAPIVGERVIARGTVIKPGSKMTVAKADIFAAGADGSDRLVAMAVGTLAAL